MSKATKSELIPSEVLPTDEGMNRVARQIEDFHIAAKHHAEQAVTNAVCCGFLCLYTKQNLPHGEFKKWLSDNVQGVVYRTVKRYMDLAENIKSDTVSLLNGSSAEDLPKALNNKDFKKNLLKEVNEFASGRSLTELYYDYGIVKQPKQDLYGTNNPEGVNGGKPEPFHWTPAVLRMRAKDAFYAEGSGICYWLAEMGQDEPQHMLWNYLELDELMECTSMIENFSMKLKQVLKDRRKKEAKLTTGGAR